MFKKITALALSALILQFVAQAGDYTTNSEKRNIVNNIQNILDFGYQICRGNRRALLAFFYKSIKDAELHKFDQFEIQDRQINNPNDLDEKIIVASVKKHGLKATGPISYGYNNICRKMRDDQFALLIKLANIFHYEHPKGMVYNNETERSIYTKSNIADHLEFGPLYTKVNRDNIPLATARFTFQQDTPFSDKIYNKNDAPYYKVKLSPCTKCAVINERTLVCKTQMSLDAAYKILKHAAKNMKSE